MGLSTRHAVAVSVLALAVVALVVDRFVLGGEPGPASAAAATPAETYAVTPRTAPTPKAPAVEASLAKRLREVARELEGVPAAHNAADVFATPAMWRKRTQETASNGAPADKAEPELPTLKLSSIMGSTHAVINGRTMAVGESVDFQVTREQVARIELVQVDGSARQVVVRVLGREIVLNLTPLGKTEPGRTPGM